MLSKEGPGNPALRTRKSGHPWGERGLSHHTGQVQLGDRQALGSLCGQDGCWGEIAGGKASAASDNA